LATTTADPQGGFLFQNVALTAGVNALTVRATNAQNESRSVTHNIILNSAPTVAGPVANFQVAAGAQDTILNFPSIFSDTDVNTLVRLNTSSGPVDIELFNQQTPLTVQNFLTYINSGRFSSTIFHRSIANFVIQGGGFRFQASPANLVAVTTDPAVQNEPVLSNQAGTVSMAKIGTDPNSATSQFFFNLVDNSRGAPQLDSQNGGFTAFGQLRGNSTQVVTQLAAIPTQNRGQPFEDIPLQNYPQPPAGNFPSDTVATNYALLVNATAVREPPANNGDALTFTIDNNSNPSLVNASIVNGARLVLKYTAGQTGQATITVKATDKNGAQATATFTVNVG
jgi:cyclophilin family peptidyl-prolyl cis-trans isomerase